MKIISTDQTFLPSSFESCESCAQFWCLLIKFWLHRIQIRQLYRLEIQNISFEDWRFVTTSCEKLRNTSLIYPNDSLCISKVLEKEHSKSPSVSLRANKLQMRYNGDRAPWLQTTRPHHSYLFQFVFFWEILYYYRK